MNMLGSSILTLGTDSRVFYYEVEGLRQTDQTTEDIKSIRQSNKVVVQVPFNRMSRFMARMNRLGCKIVSIRSSSADPVSHTEMEQAESTE